MALTTALVPGLLSIQAIPVTAVAQAATTVQGSADSPKQLTGSAEGLASLVDSAATATAVEFNNSLAILPQYALAHLGDQVSMEMWFKTTGSGVLPAASANYSAVPEGPMLYVGTDGKLRGAFKAVASPMAWAAAVNDDQWHHVALTVAGADQVLYLDGAQIGTMTGQADPWRPYAAFGNPTQRVDAAGAANYTYDDANRLKTAGDPVTGRTWTYGYDNADRLTSKTSTNPVNTPWSSKPCVRWTDLSCEKRFAVRFGRG
ncbi:LamG-like jellyroll fold domain-containing protein [Streptosporangium sp. NPDC003464]